LQPNISHNNGIRGLAAEGTLEAFVARHDARRPDIGQITFLLATLG
jgi:hypothetical protein